MNFTKQKEPKSKEEFTCTGKPNDELDDQLAEMLRKHAEAGIKAEDEGSEYDEDTAEQQLAASQVTDELLERLSNVISKGFGITSFGGVYPLMVEISVTEYRQLCMDSQAKADAQHSLWEERSRTAMEITQLENEVNRLTAEVERLKEEKYNGK